MYDSFENNEWNTLPLPILIAISIFHKIKKLFGSLAKWDFIDYDLFNSYSN